MRFLLRRCTKCKRYTLEQQCPECNSNTESAHPAKFSPDDKYARYRVRDKYVQKQQDDA